MPDCPQLPHMLLPLCLVQPLLKQVAELRALRWCSLLPRAAPQEAPPLAPGPASADKESDLPGFFEAEEPCSRHVVDLAMGLQELQLLGVEQSLWQVRSLTTRNGTQQQQK